MLGRKKRDQLELFITGSLRQLVPDDHILARVGRVRFFYSRARDCSRCSMALLCLSKGRLNKALVISDQHPALLRARCRRERWTDEDTISVTAGARNGFHGEAKTWHGLANAVRRGLQNMRIQAFLTAAAINLKRLAAALCALMPAFGRSSGSRRRPRPRSTLRIDKCDHAPAALLPECHASLITKIL
ncbi:hypothetical protein BH23BAC4_BH23BAC4_02090 [soil metagenome]